MNPRKHLQLVKHPDAAASQSWLDRAGGRFDAAGTAMVRGVSDYAVNMMSTEALAQAQTVAETLLDLELDHESVAAALLVPVLRTQPETAPEIREKFGSVVTELAEGVVRMGELGALSGNAGALKREAQAAQLEALRKMLLAMVQDVRVVLIKLADHLQELRTLVKSGDERQRKAAAVLTRDILAPLANRLGVWQIKWELEDLALRVLDNEAYKRIARLLDEKRLDRERYIENVVALLKGEIARAGIACEVNGRPKHIASIHRKMQQKSIDFEGLYDVRAVRVLVRDVKDCYAVLGIVHSLWSPLPKEFDDYIAKPKANNYRSLHTAVIGPEGKSVEVQIRTHEMHEHSELGVAAHWQYKEGGRQDRGYQEKIAWLRQVLEWKDEVRDAGEFAEQFRTELFEDSVYVFTPQGRVIDLPKGSTPVDFAYHVHTELGHRCRGAKVNGAMVPLNTPLANGQQVEILAAKQGAPSRDWLNPQLGYLKSTGGRSKVRQWFNRQNLDADIAQGRSLLEKELQRQGMNKLNLDQLAADMGFEKLPDLLTGLGRGEIGPKALRDALTGEPQSPDAEVAAPVVARPRAKGAGGVLVVGVDRLLTTMAKCCRPAPPEPIIGFVTRGRGVTVHRASCSSVRRLAPERMVTAEWGDAEGAVFPVEVDIEAADRTGLLRDILEVLSREHINVTATRSTSRDLSAHMRLALEVGNLAQLDRALALVREVRGVVSAIRR
ncbi:MAG: bifunctional (p)ppGpp synthetase/guanosine-3',5'-bis(diphosphate) 3'-pyrophosphohydrolase [Betaproteobacteria bacterium]|jgi:GTP pyrophosphokinase|nr:bifunctional (p)ppGpp synthetase/guanosine-3',5'-bis(diphosphate) 3'-pyrophosphohydrolase [Betaproteobacteria bacterium]MDH5342509.1 bifunctional (p)ppGpp synthetase/guanosine-3',5'-bis(diphosphate) 3'-pyrophosphohydrolase [Betaproteobacteria bacterium]